MKHTLLFIVIFITCLQVKAQDFPYYFSIHSGNYQDLENPVLAVPSNEVWDEPEFAIPIGFSFEISDGSYDSLVHVELGASLSFEGYKLTTRPFLIAYSSDLVDRGYLSQQSQSSISYLQEGSPGSRTLKVQWKNAGFYGELFHLGTLNDSINFQLWILEETNDIEIHIGPSSITHDSVSHQVFNGTPLIGLIEHMNFPATIFAESPFYYTYSNADTTYIRGTDWNTLRPDTLNGLHQDPMDGRIFVFSTSPRVNTLNIYTKPLTLFPNPATDIVHIQLPQGHGTADAELSVYDISGRLIARETQIAEDMTLSCHSWPTGNYAVRVQVENVIYTGKITKH